MSDADESVEAAESSENLQLCKQQNLPTEIPEGILNGSFLLCGLALQTSDRGQQFSFYFCGLLCVILALLQWTVCAGSVI